MKSITSTKTIEQTRRRSRRTASRIGITSRSVRKEVHSSRPTPKRKCTEPVAPSSGFPTDLRRSGCRLESHQPWTLRTRCSGDSTKLSPGRQAPRKENSPQFAENAETAVFRGLTPVSERVIPQRNAPSRWRLRPASRLTAAEATADRRAINLGRSVLGAIATLGGPQGAVKSPGFELLAICEIFFSQGSNCGPTRML